MTRDATITQMITAVLVLVWVITAVQYVGYRDNGIATIIIVATITIVVQAVQVIALCALAKKRKT